MYKNKTELYGKEFLVGILQNNIDEMKKNWPNDHKIMKTLISQLIATGKHHVPYGRGNGFPSPLLKIENEVCNLIIAMSKCYHPIRVSNSLNIYQSPDYKHRISGEFKLIQT